MHKTHFETIMGILQKEGLKPYLTPKTSLKWTSENLEWIDSSGDECYIYGEDIAVSGGRVAWFQSSKDDKHLLRIISTDSFFQWEPITHNPAFGCDCLTLAWYEEAVLFMYREKHYIYICIIQNQEVRYIHFHGEKWLHSGKIVSYQSYENSESGVVRLIELPSLTEMASISIEEAKRRHIMPKE